MYNVSQLQVQDGPVAPMVALTATAPPEMARRIVHALKLRSPHLELRTPVHRSNLVLRRIEATGSMRDEVAHVVGQLRAGTDGDPGPTIVYVRTCNDAEKWCELLQARLPPLMFPHDRGAPWATLGWLPNSMQASSCSLRPWR